MTPQPFIDHEPAEHAWHPCQYCGALTFNGIAHDCYEDAEPESDWVVLAVIASVAIALLLLASGKWNPGWPAS